MVNPQFIIHLHTGSCRLVYSFNPQGTLVDQVDVFFSNKKKLSTNKHITGLTPHKGELTISIHKLDYD